MIITLIKCCSQVGSLEFRWAVYSSSTSLFLSTAHVEIVKFMFSKKAAKIDEIFTINLTIYVVNVKLTVKISMIFVAFSLRKYEL